jgi:hypothetical protein
MCGRVAESGLGETWETLLWAKTQVMSGSSVEALADLVRLSTLEGSTLQCVAARAAASHLVALTAIRDNDPLFSLKYANRAIAAWEAILDVVQADRFRKGGFPIPLGRLLASSWNRPARAAVADPSERAAIFGLLKAQMLIAFVFSQQLRLDDAISIARSVAHRWLQISDVETPSIVVVNAALHTWSVRKGCGWEAEIPRGQMLLGANFRSYSDYRLTNVTGSDHRQLLEVAESVVFLPMGTE